MRIILILLFLTFFNISAKTYHYSFKTNDLNFILLENDTNIEPINLLDYEHWNVHISNIGTVNFQEDLIRISATTNATQGSATHMVAIYNNHTVKVGQKLVVESRNSAGRHAGVIGLSEGFNYAVAPHAAGMNNVASISMYGRFDNITSAFSARDVENVTFFSELGLNVRNFNTFELRRIALNQTELYMNGNLIRTYTGFLPEIMRPYFSVDGHLVPNTIEIRSIEILDL